MTETAEMLSQTAQLLAARESELDAANAQRLADWRARYWYRCVEAPLPIQPSGWPATRCEASPPLTSAESTVTPIKRKKP